MKFTKLLPRCLILAGLFVSFSANASLIDFTDNSWSTAISAGDGTTATIGSVTLTSTGGNLTFNASDNAGCVAGQPANGLTCAGDGIGVVDDEITQGIERAQSITISFLEAVNITNIFLLDLFGAEGTGEIAVIDGVQYAADLTNAGFPGGYWVTGFTGFGITSITLSGNDDSFSDYALAAIEVSIVPLPGALILFGSALLGFFSFKRRR